MENNEMYRSVVSKSNFEKSDDYVTYYKHKTPYERLQAACALINKEYNTNPNDRMDKTIVSARKHKK